MSVNFTVPLIMSGSSFEQMSLAGIYKYISIINSTDNTIEIYQRRVTVTSPTDMVGKVLPYTCQTFPIGSLTEYTFLYTDGGAAGQKVATVIFSDENLGYSGAIGTTVTGNVGIITDSVGLARQEQLPAALGASGGMKVELVADDTGGLTVGVDSLPAVDLSAKTALKVTAGGAGPQTVKAATGKVYAVVSATASVDIVLKDDTLDKWFTAAQTQSMFPVPVTCGTAIVLDFSGAGDAYILYE